MRPAAPPESDHLRATCALPPPPVLRSQLPPGRLAPGSRSNPKPLPHDFPPLSLPSPSDRYDIWQAPIEAMLAEGTLTFDQVRTSAFKLYFKADFPLLKLPALSLVRLFLSPGGRAKLNK